MDIKAIIKQPKNVLFWFVSNVLSPYIKNDKYYLELEYRIRCHKKLNWKAPRTFNEKLQCLKLYDRNSRYTELVDKYAVKNIVSNLIGKEFVIPTIAVWNTVEEIDFDSLPNQFVLKCTHDSGGVVICKDKQTLDKKKLRKILKKYLNRNYYLQHREWPYKDVPKRIIAEKYMEEESGKELRDYKFYCFNGVPKVMFIVSDRYHDKSFDYFDMDFNHLPFTQKKMLHIH
jgi:hypothetical protein